MRSSEGHDIVPTPSEMLAPTSGLMRNLVSHNLAGAFCRTSSKTLKAEVRLPKFGFQRLSSTSTAILIRPTRTVTGNGPTSKLLFKSISFAVVGLGLTAWQGGQPVKCDSSSTLSSVGREPHVIQSHELPLPPPASTVSMYELGFGTVAGICAGVFMKKGVKAAAWFLGGIFVLLQYLASQSLVRVDWSRMASRFENSFHTADVSIGIKRVPTVGSIGRALVNFLTADFQPRASFLAGFALGLRIG